MFSSSPWPALVLVLLLTTICSSAAQAPEASLQGIVTDTEGRPVVGATLTVTHADTGLVSSASTDPQGRYYFGSLPRGNYSLQIEMAGYGQFERRGIELAVGAKQEENVNLTPRTAGSLAPELSGLLDNILQPPALQVDTIASSVSVVVEEHKILQLPLADRNIYSLFLLQPGVTSQGAIVRRGLSFSTHGQRVSGSNYQLDGVDNNNIILTGPVTPTSAEAIQEFRMVNSSFSSDTGRATAFVAQAVTRSGSNRFHGSLFEFLSNDRLNGNTFENNASQVSKSHFRRNQFGYSFSGPIKKNATFFSTVLEFSRLRYGTRKNLRLPSSLFIASLPQDSEARRLLTEIPPLAAEPLSSDPDIGVARFEAVNRIDTLLATERIDHHFTNTKDRLLFRYTLASTSLEPTEGVEFLGYPSIRPTDHFRAQNALVGWTHSFNAGTVNDFRAGWSREQIDQPRPRSDVPIMQSFDGVALPGSFRQSELRENNNVIQISDIVSHQRGRSAWTVGFEFRRNLSNGVSLGLQNEALGGEARFPNGFYAFPSLRAFGAGQPLQFGLGVDRFSSGRLRLPNLNREYRSSEYAAFIQNDLKLARRFSLNLGLRYEYYGVPHNTDRSQDVNFYFGPGSTIQERLATGELRSTDLNTGDLEGLLYRRDRRNFAPSIGLAWDPIGRGQTVLRAGYSVAFDRVFDTVRDLRSNELQVVACVPPFCAPSLLVPAERQLSELNQTLTPGPIVHLDENLRTPYAQNWYVGLQQTVTPNFLVEIGHAGSVGRKLISRDVINRQTPGVPRSNPQILDDTFLSNAGNSNYLAFELGLRRRFSRGLQYQVSYTYSHAIDNQSDIFEGARTGPSRGDFALASFTRQFDSVIDRGDANFDQRHNLVFNAIWDLPPGPLQTRWLTGGWTASVIGGYRSGFPVTVIGSTSRRAAPGLLNNRPDFVGSSGQPAHVSPAPEIPGGVQWLNPQLFQMAVDHVGNLGRGAIAGPGFWNYDFAVMRQIGSSETPVRVQLRAEFYNLFNHANLSAPVSVLTRRDFGRAYFGRNPAFSRFGDLPLASPSRMIQIALRLQF